MTRGRGCGCCCQPPCSVEDTVGGHVTTTAVGVNVGVNVGAVGDQVSLT